MQTLICTEPGHFEYRFADIPELKKDYAIIKIKRIGICGTDLHAFEGTQPYFEYPRILGHELSGELIKFDNAPGFEIGESVTFIPYFNCGNCIACKMGKPNCCSSIQVCGVHADGGMSEYLSVPSYSLVHGSSLNFDELALVEPLAIGAHGVKRAGINKGKYVLIVGAGPIGLGTVEFARIAGAKVIVLDTNEGRLQFCRQKLKVEYTINPLEQAVEKQLMHITNGDMPTVVIDATGNLEAINRSFQYLAHGGTYVLVGLQKQPISFSHPEFHKREATLMSSRNALREDFEQVISSIQNEEIDPGILITHRTSFMEVKTQFSTWLDPRNGTIKAIVEVG